MTTTSNKIKRHCQDNIGVYHFDSRIKTRDEIAKYVEEPPSTTSSDWKLLFIVEFETIHLQILIFKHTFRSQTMILTAK